MEELYGKVHTAKNPLEIIELSDEFLDKQIYGYIKLMFLKGETLLSLERFDDALFVFKQILEYNDDRFTGRTHYSIGFCYSIKNEFKKAESEFKKAYEYCDEASILLNSTTLNLAAYYPKTKQKANTFKMFKEIYNLDPSNSPDDVHVSFLKIANNPEELINIFDSSIDETYNADVKVLFAKGDALVKLERFNEAISVFEEILKYPYNKDVIGKAHNAMGFCYSRKKDLVKAVSEFEKACDYSNNPTTLYNLASHYALTNQNKKALEVFRKMSDLDPNNKDIKKIIEMLKSKLNEKDMFNERPFNSIKEAFMQADIYIAHNNYEKAIGIYDLITDIMPEQPPAWNKKGYVYYQLGKFEEAMKCFDKALEYNPNSAYSMFYKSMVYMDLEDFENAQDMIVKALNIIPNNTEFLNNYCYILIKLDKNNEAIDIANKALIIEPDSVETYNNKAYALENLNRFDEAIECYNKALKINQNFFEVWCNKAFSLKNLNRFDEAIECYNKALELSPNNYHILEKISWLYVEKGDPDTAEKYFLKAIDLHSSLEENSK